MADMVERLMEAMVPELEDLKKNKIFNPAEIKSIARRRSDFEYSLRSRSTTKDDFIRYVEYELNLDTLRKQRKHNLGITQPCVSDHAIEKRVHFIFERALKGFASDIDLWLRYMEYCLRANSSNNLSRVFARAVRMHPRSVLIWTKAAQWEFRCNSNPEAARVLFQRGLRLNPASEDLWLEFFTMELQFIQKLVLRRKLMTKITTEGVTRGADDEDDLNGEGEGLSAKDAALQGGALPRLVFQHACQAENLGPECWGFMLRCAGRVIELSSRPDQFLALLSVVLSGFWSPGSPVIEGSCAQAPSAGDWESLSALFLQLETALDAKGANADAVESLRTPILRAISDLGGKARAALQKLQRRPQPSAPKLQQTSSSSPDVSALSVLLKGASSDDSEEEDDGEGDEGDEGDDEESYRPSAGLLRAALSEQMGCYLPGPSSLSVLTYELALAVFVSLQANQLLELEVLQKKSAIANAAARKRRGASSVKPLENASEVSAHVKRMVRTRAWLVQLLQNYSRSWFQLGEDLSQRVGEAMDELEVVSGNSGSEEDDAEASDDDDDDDEGGKGNSEEEDGEERPSAEALDALGHELSEACLRAALAVMDRASAAGVESTGSVLLRTQIMFALGLPHEEVQGLLESAARKSDLEFPFSPQLYHRLFSLGSAAVPGSDSDEDDGDADSHDEDDDDDDDEPAETPRTVKRPKLASSSDRTKGDSESSDDDDDDAAAAADSKEGFGQDLDNDGALEALAMDGGLRLRDAGHFRSLVRLCESGIRKSQASGSGNLLGTATSRVLSPAEIFLEAAKLVELEALEAAANNERRQVPKGDDEEEDVEGPPEGDLQSPLLIWNDLLDTVVSGYGLGMCPWSAVERTFRRAFADSNRVQDQLQGASASSRLLNLLEVDSESIKIRFLACSLSRALHLGGKGLSVEEAAELLTSLHFSGSENSVRGLKERDLKKLSGGVEHVLSQTPRSPVIYTSCLRFLHISGAPRAKLLALAERAILELGSSSALVWFSIAELMHLRQDFTSQTRFSQRATGALKDAEARSEFQQLLSSLL